jgi:Cu+-exporting ATPase
MTTHKDPVCEMMVEEGEEAGTFTYKGVKYYFCSQACVDRFKQNPESFLTPIRQHIEVPIHTDRKPTNTISTIVLPIEGMSCASCVAKIERSLSKLDGVYLANVNFGTEKAIVKYDPGLLDMNDFKLAVSSAGAYRVIEEAGDNEAETALRLIAFKNLKIKFIFSFVIAIITMLLGMREMIPVLKSIPDTYESLINYIMFILTTPVLFWAGSQFFRGAFAEAKHLSTNMDTLIALGTSVAYLYSAVVTFVPVKQTTHVYFDTTAWIIALILLGRLLEAYSKGKTTDAIKSLISLKPKTAYVIKNGHEVEVGIDEVVAGDLIRIKPGNKIPVDGVIVEGNSTIDESMLTGESIPVEKKQNDEVFAGTINISGSFILKATKVGTDTTLSQIIKLVTEAQGSKAPVERLADKVASYFVPIVIGIAIVSGILWYLLTPAHSVSLAITVLVSVLIVACPCALGLATPTAVIVGIGLGAKHGILIKGGESLEKAYGVTRIIFDKTGTLTRGKPIVTDVIPIDIDENTLLCYIASIESLSEHPVARTLVNFAQERGIQLRKVEDFKVIPGAGVSGSIDGKLIEIGKSVDNTGKDLASQGKIVLIVKINGSLSGIIGMQDTPKQEAKQAISELKKQGIKIAMVTGDNHDTALAIAKLIGIDDIHTNIKPAGKADVVKLYQQQGDKVAMVGDGINDAPALATADLGIAMGSGTDIAIETSDITIVNSELTSVNKVIKLAKNTMKTIKQNLFWAFFYNIIAIPVAAGILYPFFKILLNPVIAALAMAFSSVSVVSNSLRLKNTTV